MGLASRSAMAVARNKGRDVVALAQLPHKNDVGMLVDSRLDAADSRQLASDQNGA